MSIRFKSIIILISVYVLFVASSLPFGLGSLKKMTAHSLDQRASQMIERIDIAMSAKKDVWLTNALQISTNPIVSEAVARGDREPVIELLEAYSKMFKENTNFKNVRTHIIAKDLTSFVKNWDAETFGEDLSYSPSYKTVLKTGEPVVTMEQSPKGLRLKGLFPIVHNSTVVGITNFEGGLNSIKRDFKESGLDFLYMLDDTYAPLAVSLSEAPAIGSFLVSQSDIDKEFLTYAQNHSELLNSDKMYEFDKDYLTVVQKIKNTDDAVIGLFLLGEKTSLATEIIKESERIVLSLLFLFFAFFFLFIIIILLFLERSVVHPVRSFSVTFDVIAEGNLNHDISVSRKSYMGSLAETGMNMMNKIRNFILDAQTTAIDQEQKQLELVVELEKTLSAANRISLDTSLTQKSSKILSHQVDETKSAVFEIEERMELLLSRMEEQQNSVDQTASAQEEMAASIKSISQIAEERKESSEDLLNITRKGESQVKITVDKIDSIGHQVEDVMGLIDLINNIAEETNLLAMNAAIEAAHAGEAGKGFSVVANEIRKLATSTQGSSKQISISLNSLVSEIRESVELSRKTNSIFSDIKGRSQDVTSSFQEISMSTSELSAGSDEIVVYSGHLRQITDDLSKGLNEISSSVNKINDSVQITDYSAKEVEQRMSSVKKGIKEVNSSINAITGTTESNITGMRALLKKIGSFHVSDEQGNIQTTAEERAGLSCLIVRHASWISKARSIIDGSDKSASADSMVDSHACDMGHWMDDNENSNLIPVEKMTKLKKEHSEMHNYLKEILELKRSGEDAEEKFQKMGLLSQDIVSDISEIHDLIEPQVR